MPELLPMTDGSPPVVRTVADLVDRLLPAQGPSPRIVGVAGAPGAGKTTLVQNLVRAVTERDPGVQPAHVPGDGFHLGDAELTRLGRLDRKGAPDTFDPAGYAALLERLRDPSRGTVYAPAFDRTLEQPVAGAIPIPRTCHLVLTECNYLLLDEGPWPAVRRRLDEVWFVEVVDDDERRRRLVERHIRFGKTRSAAEAWVEEVDEPNARLVAATRCRADVLVAGSALDAA